MLKTKMSLTHLVALRHDVPYFIILLCLTPDDFTCQGESTGSWWVNWPICSWMCLVNPWSHIEPWCTYFIILLCLFARLCKNIKWNKNLIKVFISPTYARPPPPLGLNIDRCITILIKNNYGNVVGNQGLLLGKNTILYKKWPLTI
jgi:hypothetical protein